MINPCSGEGHRNLHRGWAKRFRACPSDTWGWGYDAGRSAAAASAAQRRKRLPQCRATSEAVLARTGVLLMPSLWYEGFRPDCGRGHVERNSRDLERFRRLAEAKMGRGSSWPAPAVARYEPVFDERGMPVR